MIYSAVLKLKERGNCFRKWPKQYVRLLQFKYLFYVIRTERFLTINISSNIYILWCTIYDISTPTCSGTDVPSEESL